MPEEIGTKMFQQDVLRPFNPMRNAVVDTVAADYPAMAAGFKKGDSIVSVNGIILFPYPAASIIAFLICIKI